MDNSLYIDVSSMAASNELISTQSKTASLNVLRQKLLDIQAAAKDPYIKSMVEYDLTIIEDCYEIDMYKFQFKGLLDILQKDIANMGKAVVL